MRFTRPTGADFVRPAVVVAALATLAGCPKPVPPPDYAEPMPSSYVDIDSDFGGTGIAMKDVDQVVDKMVRAILANPELVGRNPPARIIIDATRLKNQSSSTFNMEMLADEIRSGVGVRAAGKVIILERAVADVEENRQLIADGIMDEGGTPMTERVMSADYQFEGTIQGMDEVNRQTTGMKRSFVFIMRLVNLKTRASVELGRHRFAKAGTDDVEYR